MFIQWVRSLESQSGMMLYNLPISGHILVCPSGIMLQISTALDKKTS